MPHLLDSGTKHTTARAWEGEGSKRLVKLLRTRRRARVGRRSSLHVWRRMARSSRRSRDNSRLVVFMLLFHPGLVKAVVAMATSWRVKSLLSTSVRSGDKPVRNLVMVMDSQWAKLSRWT